MLIFIRHADDEYEDKTFAHDTQITSTGKRRARKVGREISAEYGVPSEVHYSPFRRTEQTMKWLLHGASINDVTKVSQPQLSRWFSPTDMQDPDISYRTQSWNPPLNESFAEFQSRIDYYLFQLLYYVRGAGKGKVIWIITHTLAYKHIAAHFEHELPKRIPFASWFAVPI